MKRSLVLACVLSLSCPSLLAQYRDDLNHVVIPKIDIDFHPPTAIGNLGDIDTVVDLRGFMPMLLMTNYDSSILRAIDKYKFDWFKVPTPQALHLLYPGDLTLQQVITGTGVPTTGPLAHARFINEEKISRHDRFWLNLAYDSVKDGPQLYKQLVGGDGFEGAEPVTILFSHNSVFLFLSFKYSSVIHWGQGGEGQLLVALEFSRFEKKYRAIYQIYSTAAVNKSVSDLFLSSMPYIGKAIDLADRVAP
jgi:hypothetical protein